jgi:protein-S-isoprenylcysteine O-methyltransferase Ste14
VSLIKLGSYEQKERIVEQGQIIPTRSSGTQGNVPQAALRLLEARFFHAYAAVASSRIGRLAGQVLVCTFWVLFLWSKGVHLITFLSARPVPGDVATDVSFWSVALYHVLSAVFVLLIVVLMLVRKPAKQFVRSFGGAVIALAGTFLPSFLIFSGTAHVEARLAAAAGVFLIVGMGYAIWALSTLGRCLSMMPEVRGLVTSGPYARVRHPLYLGEMIATLGVLLPILSPRNVAIFVIFCGLQLWRTRYEEAMLSSAFPDYADYRDRTARVLPGLY